MCFFLGASRGLLFAPPFFLFKFPGPGLQDFGKCTRISIFFGGVEGGKYDKVSLFFFLQVVFFESEVSRNDAYTDNTYLVYIHCSIYVNIDIMK